MLIALILTLFLSRKISKAIIEPINKLDLEFPENNETYEELTPLLEKIADQNQTIDDQLANAHKMQNEFNLITENMSEGFLVIDQDANLLTYNSAAQNCWTLPLMYQMPIINMEAFCSFAAQRNSAASSPMPYPEKERKILWCVTSTATA